MPFNSMVTLCQARIRAVLTRFSDWLWVAPRLDGGWLAHGLQAGGRVLCIASRGVGQDRIPLRASALTFTVILSLVPLLALGTSVLKGLGASDQMRQAVHSLISQMEITVEVVTSGSNPGDSASSKVAAFPARQWSPDTFSGHLHQVADTIFDYVDKTRFATMGVAGILVLLFTVYTLLGSVEETFNAIWKTDVNRTLGRKLVDYLALLILLPLIVNFEVAAMAVLQSPKLLGQVQNWLPWLGTSILSLLPVLVMVVTFSMLYGFMPNVRVSKRAALVGGVVGGLSWLLLQAVYFKLQTVVVRYNAIYGSFAALPLFLLWVYLSWLVFLLGAEISYGAQTWRRAHGPERSLSPIGRVALAFEILAVVAEDYRRHRLTTRDNLVGALQQSDKGIKELLDSLCAAGVLRYVSEGDGGYLPTAPLAGFAAAEIGQVMLGELPETVPANNPARRALVAMRASLAETRLGGGRPV